MPPVALVREPMGARDVPLPLGIGAEGSALVVPGDVPVDALLLDYEGGTWRARVAEGASCRLNGRRMQGMRELRSGDVLALGDAQIVLRDDARHVLAVDIVHLVGNATIAPLAPQEQIGADDEDDDIEIELAQVPGTVVSSRGIGSGTPRIAVFAVAIVGLLLLAALALLQRVQVDVTPESADVRSRGALFSWHSGDTLFVWPGSHRVVASAPGYVTAEKPLAVTRGSPTALTLRLAKEPGVLEIDTGGVQAEVSIDGVRAGRAPGDLRAAAGSRTLILRAPRHLDAVAKVEVEGLGKRQRVEVAMTPSWGTLAASAEAAGAQLQVGDAQPVPMPARVDLPAGVHRVRVSSPGAKPWESSIVVKAGETLAIGPIALGIPDARYVVRSNPSGADVTVGGVYRGRTPLTVDLAPGMTHELLVARTGYGSFSRSVEAASGTRTVVDAKLVPQLVELTLRGEPADALVAIDGKPRGRAAQTIAVPSGNHRIEVTREGLAPFTTTVTLAPGFPRTIEYRLTEPGRASNALALGSSLATGIGYSLRLVKPVTFTMGSDRREQGRRPNESQRSVTLSRGYYIGATEVTNAQFRRFKADHDSGFIDRQSIDLDSQPVTRVSWDQAVEFCQWLSAQEGLPAAYEKRDGRYVLVSPMSAGYRLPTEAEWEYAARYTRGGALRRYVWGDALPIPESAGNLGGLEARGTMDPILESYRDTYAAVAPVAKFAANDLGLHDMGGNVSEWMHDLYSSFIDANAVTDPLGPAEGTRHVVRGANWRTATVADLRLAWRDGAEQPGQNIGFRVARNADP